MGALNWLNFTASEQRGGTSWGLIANILAYDGNNAYASSASPYITYPLIAKTIDFGGRDISSLLVLGLEIRIKEFYTGGGYPGKVKDNSVQLMVQNTLQGADKATANDWPSGSPGQFRNYGGSSDLWGLGASINPANLMRSDFGIGLKANLYEALACYANVDVMQVKIYYKSKFFFVL